MSPQPWLQLYLPAVSFILPSAVIILLYLIIALTIFRKTRIRSRCGHSRGEMTDIMRVIAKVQLRH